MKLRMLGMIWMAGALCGASSQAMTARELAAARASGEKITLIDVRSTAQYKKNHIPGAINVPAALCAVKQLPPLGRVVVYDGGLDQSRAAEQAAAALNQKAGIQAEILEGGLAAWESLQLATTAGRGVAHEELPVITYQQLKTAPPDDLVLVDLRVQGQADRKKDASEPPLTNLREEFPQARIADSPFEVLSRAKKENRPPPVLVLIDRGDGKAEETARLLKANGVKRFVILAGGEHILARKGRPGLQRSGAVVSVSRPVLPPKKPPTK